LQDPEGVLHGQRFWAKYHLMPNFGGSGRRYSDEAQPTTLRLFFPRDKVLPLDLWELLRTFVPEPPLLTVDASDELPAQCGGHSPPVDGSRPQGDDQAGP
jgi:hypothetical protein